MRQIQISSVDLLTLPQNRSHIQCKLVQLVRVYSVLTEVIMEARDNRQQLNMAFMDSSKAFDTVDQDSMLCTIHTQGVQDCLWKIDGNTYTRGKQRT